MAAKFPDKKRIDQLNLWNEEISHDGELYGIGVRVWKSGIKHAASSYCTDNRNAG